MSVLSELFDTSSSQQDVAALSEDSKRRLREYYTYLKANYPAQYEVEKGNDPAYQQQLRDEAAALRAQAMVAQSQQSNVLPTTASTPPVPTTTTATAPTYTGPTAFEKLSAILPSGFEQTALPSSFANPFIESSLGAGRSKAQEFIDRALARGTVTEAGRTRGLEALGTQDPDVRRRLTDVSNVLLEQERAKLRGIAGTGYQAAQGQSGEFFDPTQYQQQTQTELGQFQQAFPQSYTTAVGDVGGLYNTGALGGAAGLVERPLNVQYDPYAVEGGKLTSGTEEEPAPPASAKKRTTAVF